LTERVISTIIFVYMDKLLIKDTFQRRSEEVLGLIRKKLVNSKDEDRIQTMREELAIRSSSDTYAESSCDEMESWTGPRGSNHGEAEEEYNTTCVALHARTDDEKRAALSVASPKAAAAMQPFAPVSSGGKATRECAGAKHKRPGRAKRTHL
jgi:hypothetical protein